MGVTVQFLAGVVRSGAQHHKYGDPYEFVATWASTDGKTFEMIGLVTSDEKPLSMSIARAGLRAVAKATGMRPKWTRIEVDPCNSTKIVRKVKPQKRRHTVCKPKNPKVRKRLRKEL